MNRSKRYIMFGELRPSGPAHRPHHRSSQELIRQAAIGRRKENGSPNSIATPTKWSEIWFPLSICMNYHYLRLFCLVANALGGADALTLQQTSCIIMWLGRIHVRVRALKSHTNRSRILPGSPIFRLRNSLPDKIIVQNVSISQSQVTFIRDAVPGQGSVLPQQWRTFFPFPVVLLKMGELPLESIDTAKLR